ncbi:MAG: asparagine synthase (glutamine-hydrolyzing) [Salibacteraceae bacterium]
MCGISGIITLNELSSGHLEAEVHSMNELIKHRGPDNEGILIFDTKGNSYIKKQNENCVIGFGHRRLSIIDLSDNANQPMSEETGRYSITYNGEIYNYIELRKELEQASFKFHSNSDTEVILKGYQHWGHALYDKLEGMWAFAIHDKVEQTVILSRDRTGVKPLFYSSNSNEFRFASEIKALLPYCKKSLNLDSFSNYVLHNEVHFGQNTFFNEIKEVDPGFEIQINTKTIELKKIQFFDPSLLLNTVDTNSKSTEILSEELFDILQRAINLHYRSDVPVGSNLSGGLDSSTIVGLMRALNPDISIPVFSAIFPGEQFDESELIRLSVKKHNLNWHQCEPSANEFFNSIEDVAHTQEFPLISTSTFAQYNVMHRASKEGVKVLINGQGADELLGGYYKYGEFRQWQNLKNFDFKKALHGPADLKRLTKLIGKKSLSKFSPRLITQLNPDYKYLSKMLRVSDYYQTKPIPKNLNEFLLQDYYQGFLTGLLRAEDRNSMRFSIESRVPFANSHELAKWAFSLPPRLKYHYKENKPLLRNMLKNKNIVPRKVLNKETKLGFSTPMNSWLNANHNDLIDYIDYIPNELLTEKNIKTDLRLHILKNKNNPDELPRIFKWISLGAWFKVFNVS